MPASKMRDPRILCSGKSMSCFLPLILLYNAVTLFKTFSVQLSRTFSMLRRLYSTILAPRNSVLVLEKFFADSLNCCYPL